MGQKCSCFKSENLITVNIDDEYGNTGTKYNYSPIVNIENTTSSSFIRSTTKKGIAASFNSQFATKDTLTSTLTDNNIIQNLIKFQSIVRGYLSRNFFKKCKTIYEQITIDLIKDYNKLIIHPNDKNFIYKVDGYKKFYPENDIDGPCIINYGQVYLSQLKIYNNGDSYSGQINIKNQRHGIGKLIKANGSIFHGSWLNDNFTGYGVYLSKEGTFQEGK